MRADSETIPQPASVPDAPTFRIEAGDDQGVATDRDFLTAARQAGFHTLQGAQLRHLFFVQGQITAAEAERLAQEVLADPLVETFSVERVGREASPGIGSAADHFVDVTLLPGVTDAAAENLLRAAHLLGLKGVQRAATGRRILLWGELDEAELLRLAEELCANPVVQRYSVDRPLAPPFFPYQEADGTVEVIPIREADEATLCAISEARRLALDLAEMQAIQAYFRAEGRDPTDVELEMLAQTWSEHCVHKTFKAIIDYHGPSGADPYGPRQRQKIDGLLRTHIRAATEAADKPWVRSAFVDNAGIVAFDEAWDLAFKVETHNHPSALEPFGGANTGVGGVVRDVLGVSARPIANTDVLCFGPSDLPQEALPAGVLHPRRIADGVVQGIEDYGNKMGIPTVNGAILYHQGYTANPLVYCGCLGILPRGSHPTAARPGDLIVVVGGRTGRDGLRGATFSSMAMDATTGQVAGSAVQIGNPIREKQVVEVVLRARDEGLYQAITDCGAGGLSSAVGEMGGELGAQVQLEKVRLKYPGLRPWEIWLSEAQERMVLAVPPAKWARLQEICAGQDVEAVCLGTFVDSGRLHLSYDGRTVADLSMAFLHEGLPQRRMKAVWEPPAGDGAAGDGKDGRTPEAAEALLALLAHPDIRSKEDVIRRYDHEVQGGTAVNPLVGRDNHGPGDAAVLVPLDTLLSGPERGPAEGGPEQAPTSNLGFPRAAALGNGICPQYGALDPYAMAWAAVDEALRNVVAVGADPDRVAILDNFCWGDPSGPDRLGSLVRCTQGCHDVARAYQTPFISGKDSLNNEYRGPDGRQQAIPGTLLISALGIVPDAARTTTMDLKEAGNLLYVVGETRGEMGGSHYQMLASRDWGSGTREDGSRPPLSRLDAPPQLVPTALEHFRALHGAIGGGLVQACHDCAEGGLAVALAEMCLAGRVGAKINLAAVPVGNEPLPEDVLLFCESLSRFVVEVRPEDAGAFSASMAGVPHAQIGRVGGSVLQVSGHSGEPILELPVADLEKAWRGQRPGVDEASRVKSGTAAEESPISNLHSPFVASRPRVLILHANGTNRDREAALACQVAGGETEIVHVNQLLGGGPRLADYHMLVVPGGFSYGDHLGAGRLWALDLQQRLRQQVQAFVQSGRPVLGICNGFQVLVKAGLLPGSGEAGSGPVTLTYNDSGHFECRWVTLEPNEGSDCLFTRGLAEPIYCPVAHGEGRLAVRDEAAARWLQAQGLIALTYAGSRYPANPNGSALNIAGLCNPAGNVLGLMPHPEDHIFPWQHPRWHRGERGLLGLPLFANGIKYA